MTRVVFPDNELGYITHDHSQLATEWLCLMVMETAVTAVSTSKIDLFITWMTLNDYAVHLNDL